MELWDYQKQAVEHYKDKKYFGLLFDCGLGKTLTAARIAEKKEKDVLIIAPNALCKQWETELLNTGDDRITEKKWEVLLCTSNERKHKDFNQKLKDFLAL